MGRQQHRVHGDPRRFDAIATFIGDRFGRRIRYIADVAGGQGLLARSLVKKYNYVCDVIDPRGWVLKGVSARQVEFVAKMAEYYDLVVGLHPDEALREVVVAAHIRPVILVPCCNFWSSEKLGGKALLEAIERHYRDFGITCERVTFDFAGPKNVGLVAVPPGWAG